MKTKIITLVLLCGVLLNNKAYSQTETVYDFYTGKPTTIKPINFEEQGSYRIQNINRYLYEVIIKSKNQEYRTEPSELFSQVMNMDLEKPNKSNVVDETKANVQTNKTLDTDDKTNLKNILNNLKSFNNLDKWEEKVSERWGDVNFENSEIGTGPKGTPKPLATYSLFILNSNMLGSDFNKLEGLKTAKNELINLLQTSNLTSTSANDKYEKILEVYPDLVNPKKLSLRFSTQFNRVQASYSKYINDTDMLIDNTQDELIKSVKDIADENNRVKKLYDNYNYDSLFHKLDTLKILVQNESSFTIVSDPVQATGDYVKYQVEIKPRKDIKSLGILETRNFDFEVPVEGGLKLDFSTGLFLKGFLNERLYEAVPTNSDSTSFNISDITNKNIIGPSLGALMHISKRKAAGLKAGFTFGFGLNSTDLTETSIFTGLSFMLGKSELFMISGGAAFKPIDYLKGKYEVDESYVKNRIDDELSTKTMRSGAFVSFTYNLTNKRNE